ncbi:MAG: hypothetical protein IBX55_08855 [Methyloprofundus sp.]|nr:hypothetical protein [Methyloprofundus sp.]
MMTICALSKRGYGSIKELQELDTPDFLDVVEFEQMSNAIERYEIEQRR